MSIIQGVGSGEVSTGFYPFSIGQSLRFNSGDTAFLSRTTGSATNTFTFSTWLKRGDIPSADYQYIFSSGNAGLAIGKSGDSTLEDHLYVYNGSSLQEADPLIRDGSSWYHILLSSNSGTGVLYLNGESIKTGISVASLSTSSGVTRVGRFGNGNFYLDGYLAETHLVTGSALTPSSFGETKNDIWIPKNYSGSHGDDGFKLTYSDSSDIGNDSSGENHDLTPSGLQTNDVVSDSPTNNHPTLNPVYLGFQALNNGNLEVIGTDIKWSHAKATMSPATGKWYCEVEILFENDTVTDRIGVGIINIDTGTPANLLPTQYLGQSVDSWSYFENGQVWNSNGNTGTVTTYTTGDIIGMALDLDSSTQTITWFKNNTQIVQKNLDDGRWTFAVTTFDIGSGLINFGQLGFTYTPPAGFEALNAANLPDPGIDPNENETPDQYFDTTTYTANNGTLTITGLEFQPDWVWIKARSLDIAHALFDVIRGTATAGSTNTALGSNRVDTQGNGNGVLSAFTSDGFTVAGGSSGSNPRSLVNKGTNTYVAWCWKAGGTASANNDGTQEVQLSVNTEAKFSIAKFTGTQQVNAPTFGHGLGVTPELIIIKGITEAQGWYVFGDVIGASGSGNFLKWDSNSSRVTGSASSNVTFNATTIGLDSNTGINASSDTFICYSFASVDGYSKIGSYEGNNSADNTFVYTGFRPAWVMIKNIDASGSWGIWDTKRNTENVSRTVLYADQSVVENTTVATNDIDILSNGFKVRGSAGFTGDAVTYLYMAFAKQPFKYSNAR